MKICLVNANPKKGNKKKNIKKIEKIVKEESAELYVFGEMFLTGYICREEIVSFAEKEDGESIKEIQKIARDKNCGIIFGMPIEKRRGLIYNSAVMVTPHKVYIYTKNFLANFGPFEEKFYFAPGNELPVFNTEYGRIGMCICYDIFFPELVKGMSLKGADLIVCISASPSTTKIYFERVLPARAIENTVFVSYSNLVGEEDGLTFWGGGQIYSPKGDLLARAEYFKEDFVTYDIDFEMLREARIGRPTLKNTKPDLFLDLYNIAKDKDVFNEYVRMGIKIGEKIKNKMVINEVEVYGNEDVAFGIKLSVKCDKIKVIPSDRIKAIFIGKEKVEIDARDI
ncbi:MAG TPA: carbon-nitrogen hydrolase family protein [Thermoplasmata archaeon]|nr:carbon-nitrogen hydrolase family protein [Thermoplasmata archaeon]